MQERSRNMMNPELMMGGLLMLVGAAALVGELNSEMAEAILRLWPVGLIGWGVALIFRTEASK